ncbi:hypothetical protein L6452_43858 [Arctium lappa]|uniref:Uncharacterized protein n=1 Tax=Arctium lappa TaxID=4217 RepID=A0ACB8XDP0_ARCLA|nr:hypothetical protein L6452_43858 [Arctium lappa]
MDHPSTEFESGRFSLSTSLCQSLSVDLRKSLRKPFQQVILDYDYTFTTPYSGSEIVETGSGADSEGNSCCLKWEECEEQINVVALASKEPILFYDEVVRKQSLLSFERSARGKLHSRNWLLKGKNGKLMVAIDFTQVKEAGLYSDYYVLLLLQSVYNSD